MLRNDFSNFKEKIFFLCDSIVDLPPNNKQFFFRVEKKKHCIINYIIPVKLQLPH